MSRTRISLGTTDCMVWRKTAAWHSRRWCWNEDNNESQWNVKGRWYPHSVGIKNVFLEENEKGDGLDFIQKLKQRIKNGTSYQNDWRIIGAANTIMALVQLKVLN